MRTHYNTFIFSGLCFTLLLVVNIVCFLITKCFTIGFNDITLGAYLVLPACYALMSFIFSTIVQNRVVWILPCLLGLLYFISSYPRSIYGQDLVIEINVGLSGIFNIAQFLIQENRMNNLFSFYFLHIFGMILYLIAVMKFCYYKCPFIAGINKI